MYKRQGIAGGARVKKAGAKPEMGSPEQFYAEVIRQPSLAIEIPEYRKDDMEELRLIPLEYLYSCLLYTSSVTFAIREKMSYWFLQEL